MEKLEIFVNRMKKLGIDVELIHNYPWIYIYKINGKRVTERFEADWGFTIAFLPARRDLPFHFTDITKIFELIRKYIKK